MIAEGKLVGTKAIVTGGSGRIGEFISRTLAREGAFVAVAGRNLQNAQQVVSEIERQGGTALAIQVDVTRSQEVTEMVKEILDRWGAIDILVNNAGGFYKNSSFIEVTEDDWDFILDLNIKSVFLCSRAVAKHMMERRKGKIINISSQAGISPYPQRPSYLPYGVAKAAVIGLTKHLAKELGPYGITVNAVSPGTTVSSRGSRVTGRIPDYKKIAEMTALGRLPEPQDSAEAVLFLSSESSRHITGVNLSVHSGALIL
jgi:3-oxoacyl-[acyl-carrier protein] reductase